MWLIDFYPNDDGVDDDDDMCRNQKRFWEKTRFDETAAAFEIQKERKWFCFMLMFKVVLLVSFMSGYIFRVYLGWDDRYETVALSLCEPLFI